MESFWYLKRLHRVAIKNGEFMLNIQFQPLLDGFNSKQKNDLYFLGTFSSDVEAIDQNNRPKLDLSLVIDRSGSMEGSPLENIKSAVSHFVDQLQPSDKLSVIQYDHEADTIYRRSNLNSVPELRLSLSRLRAGGSTDILNGWRKGFHEFPPTYKDDSIKRIMLFSDGEANSGATKIGSFAPFIREAADHGILTSSYGIGHYFNEQLMAGIAELGGGRSVYGQTASELFNPMIEELDLLKSLVASDLKLKIKPAKGIFCEVLNPYQSDKKGVFELPSVAAGGETWVLIKVRADQIGKKQVLKGEMKIFDIRLKYQDMVSNTSKTIKHPVTIKIVSENQFAKLKENTAVRNRLNEILISFEQNRAYQAMERDDWETVNKSLEEIDRLSKDDPWLFESNKVLKTHYRNKNSRAFMKEAHYKSSHLSKRMLPQNSSNIVHNSLSFDDNDDNRFASYLRRKKDESRR